jgi:hypothetical protein
MTIPTNPRVNLWPSYRLALNTGRGSGNNGSDIGIIASNRHAIDATTEWVAT